MHREYIIFLITFLLLLQICTRNVHVSSYEICMSVGTYLSYYFLSLFVSCVIELIFLLMFYGLFLKNKSGYKRSLTCYHDKNNRFELHINRKYVFINLSLRCIQCYIFYIYILTEHRTKMLSDKFLYFV